MPGRFTATLLEKEICAQTTGRFVFSRPDGHEYRPGQWLRLTLETAEGEETKTFSYASAPADPGIEIATRLSGSAFKRALVALEHGAEVMIAGPGGRLGLPQGASRVVLLVGGVGITPVRSILRDAAQGGHGFEDALLVYGNRDDECVLFGEELRTLGAAGVRTVDVYEHPPAGWNGESGFVTADIVRKHLCEPSGYTYVVTGPPAMVDAMVRVLDELGVPEGARVVESFGPALRPSPMADRGEHSG